jgi:hypothetical protein
MTGVYFTMGLANLVKKAGDSFTFDGKKPDHTGTKAGFSLVKYRKLSISKTYIRLFKIDMIATCSHRHQTAISHARTVADFHA